MRDQEEEDQDQGLCQMEETEEDQIIKITKTMDKKRSMKDSTLVPEREASV